jgi:hypothetical protein
MLLPGVLIWAKFPLHGGADGNKVRPTLIIGLEYDKRQEVSGYRVLALSTTSLKHAYAADPRYYLVKKEALPDYPFLRDSAVLLHVSAIILPQQVQGVIGTIDLEVLGLILAARKKLIS